MDNPQTKECMACKEVLPIEAFGRNRARADGIDVYCKQCKSKKSKESRGRLKLRPGYLREEDGKLMLSKNCSRCGREFVVPVALGKSCAKYCSDECRQWRKIEADKKKEENGNRLHKCANPTCGRSDKALHRGFCSRCYYYLRKDGEVPIITKDDRVKREKQFWTASGYKIHWEKHHPLARSSGGMPEHRWVMYEHAGPGPHKCFWCGAELADWSMIVIDHLNEIKHDNTIENLVISCNKCNRLRGAFKAFFRDLLVDKFDIFCEIAKKHMLGNNMDGLEHQNTARGG